MCFLHSRDRCALPLKPVCLKERLESVSRKPWALSLMVSWPLLWQPHVSRFGISDNENGRIGCGFRLAEQDTLSLLLISLHHPVVRFAPGALPIFTIHSSLTSSSTTGAGLHPAAPCQSSQLSHATSSSTVISLSPSLGSLSGNFCHHRCPYTRCQANPACSASCRCQFPWAHDCDNC